MEYQISKDLKGKFALRKTLRMQLVVIILSIIMLGLLSMGLNEGHSLFDTPLIGIIIALNIFTGLIWYLSNLNIAGSYLIIFDEKEKAIIKTLKSSRLNAVNQLGANVAARKYGTKQHQIIPFNEIESIALKKDNIEIVSKHYDFWNGNGKISIPKELENYEDLLEKIQVLQKRSTE